MEKIRLTKKELSFIIKMNLNPYAMHNIVAEGIFDKSAEFDKFEMNIKECDLSNLDPRFTGLLFSDDPSAPRIFGKIIDKAEAFLSESSFLGWRNILEALYNIGKSLGMVAVGGGLVFLEVIKQIFIFLQKGLLPPLSAACQYLTELSRLFGEIFQSLTNVIGSFIPSKPEFLKKIEAALDAVSAKSPIPIFF